MRINNNQRGSSLVEVLLVIAVMVMLAGASVISFSSQLQRSSLAEGVSRVQSMLRFARAEAANSGHKVQIQFAPARGTNAVNSTVSAYEPKISCEMDPLNAPGVFSEMQDIAWMDESIMDLVQVESVHPLEAEEPQAVDGVDSAPLDTQVTGLEENSEPSAITFYPDGSSDSVGIVLISTDSEDARRVQLKLIGLTGSIEQNSLEEEETESCAALAQPDRPSRDISSK